MNHIIPFIKVIGIIIWFMLYSNCNGCLFRDRKEVIKLGVINGLEADLMETVQEIAQKDYGLNIAIVEFNDYITPNMALNDHDIDANLFQHEPYLRQMVKDRDLKIISIAKAFIYPLAAYSKKIKSKNELNNNAKIAIPNDPTNEARALLLLQHHGYIKLRDNNNSLSQIKDIIENPYNFSFIPIDAAQLPRILDDVDVAIITTTFAKPAGLDPIENGLFAEDKNSLYVNVIAIREQDKDKPWVNKLIKSLHNDKVIKAAQKLFSGAVLIGWDND